MGNKYVNTGKCIWCEKCEPEVTFSCMPHIIPNSLGGTEIGLDICDDCNHYFGTAKQRIPNVDLVVKEVLNALRVFGNDIDGDTHKKYSSIFFSYWHSKREITIKRSFNGRILARQFKRGLYNIFLQKYHMVTGKGNNSSFDMIRKFARYDKGNPHVYYAFNHIILAPIEDNHPFMPITEYQIDQLFHTGIFKFWILGHTFYLEVFPTLFITNGRDYLQKEAKTELIPIQGDECIFEFDNILQIDFLMNRLHSQTKIKTL